MTNTYSAYNDSLVEAVGIVEWDDADNAKGVRPQTVTVHLLNNNEEVESYTFDEGEDGYWSFNFGAIPIADRANYTITADDIEGYTVDVINTDSPMFQITYTLVVDEDEKVPAELDEEPTALDLTYTGEAQTLIEAGKATGGTLMYALGENATTAPASGYSIELPQGTNAGTYYVWYYVDGDALHTDTEPQCLTVTIKKKYFTGHSLSLNGDIGVNFFIDLTAEEAANTTVTFTWLKQGAEMTATVDMKDAELCSYGYRAACNVSASEMEADITATLTINGAAIEETNTYSVAQYADVILNDSDFAESYIASENAGGKDGEQRLADLRALAGEMLVYGENAAVYFDENAQAGSPVSAEIPDAYAEYTETDLPANVEFDGASLSLRSETTLSLYFKSKQELTLTCEGKTIETESANGEHVIRIRNIAADELNDSFTVKVNGTGTVTYSPLTYCYRAQSSANAKLVNVAKAVYNYWVAADRFFA